MICLGLRRSLFILGYFFILYKALKPGISASLNYTKKWHLMAFERIWIQMDCTHFQLWEQHFHLLFIYYPLFFNRKETVQVIKDFCEHQTWQKDCFSSVIPEQISQNHLSIFFISLLVFNIFLESYFTPSHHYCLLYCSRLLFCLSESARAYQAARLSCCWPRGPPPPPLLCNERGMHILLPDSLALKLVNTSMNPDVGPLYGMRDNTAVVESAFWCQLYQRGPMNGTA